MKRIIKGHPPANLRKWFREQHGLNCSYGDMPTDLKNEVKERLIAEQGHLCCYTGKRIEMDDSHIEHLKPQTISRQAHDHDDANYENMLAAYPGEQKPNWPYGAVVKGDWYDVTLFVSPLGPDCEQKFVFNFEGEITPRNPTDVRAVETIRKLALDHEYLNGDRKAAIDEFLFADEISEAQARRLKEQVMLKNARGQFRQFCFVLAQACEEYIRRLEKGRAKRLAIQRQRD